MRIGINLIPLRPGQMGGLEFYVRSLLEQLLVHDTSHQYFLFTAWWNDASIDFQTGRYRKILVIRAPAHEWEHEDGLAHEMHWTSAWYRRLSSLRTSSHLFAEPLLDLHHWVRRLRLDLWFCPMTDLEPRNLAIPTVITIADIQQEFYPEFFSQQELNHRALVYLPSCQEATAVITVSQASRNSLIERYNLGEEKVHCIYKAGVQRMAALPSGPSAEQVRQKYHIPPAYAFYPAAMWPHKNHHMLILALHRLRKVYGITLPLVLTGDDMGQWKRLEEITRHFQLHEYVYYLGDVTAEELPSLYVGATLLVFPSLYEGFGVPLIEAMTLGCPVAAANVTSIPEVVGDAAILCDPRSPDSVAEAIYRIASDDRLRQTLRTRGRQQAALFSWKKVADATLQVFTWARSYHKAVQQATRPQRARLDGVYIDGWTTRQVRLDLPSREAVEAVKLEGLSDYVTYPLTIRMKVGGRVVSQQTLDGPGRFTMVGLTRRSWQGSSRLKIELLANRDFVPERVGIAADPRRLAYIIERLVLVGCGGEEIPLYTRPSFKA